MPADDLPVDQFFLRSPHRVWRKSNVTNLSFGSFAHQAADFVRFRNMSSLAY